MKFLVDIPPKMLERIKVILAKREYEDLNQMVMVALDNQIRAELDEGNSWGVPYSETSIDETTQNNVPNLEATSQSTLLFSRPLNYPSIIDPPNDSVLFGGPLWGQFYKFLPVKVGLRVLANMSKYSLPNFDQFRLTGVTEAISLGRIISKMDKKLGRKFGEKLSTSFPSNNDKSKKRFMDQYLVYYRTSDSKIDSLPARMKWLNIVKEEKSLKVGITKAGYEFVKLGNSILDSDGTEPLSFEEKEFILNHIVEHNSAEAQHITLVLRAILLGASSREQLNQKMGITYRKHWKEAEIWSTAVINTMRAGVVSRLFELGLIEKHKCGVMVSYKVSTEGSRWLERLEQKFQPLEVKMSG